MLRAILFDFNGVLMDDEALHFELFRKVLAEEGIELGEEEYYREYVGCDDEGCFSAVLEKAGRAVDAPSQMRLIARKASYYQAAVRENGYPFFEGARELIEAAAAERLTLGIVSGALRREIEGALRQAGLVHRFKSVVAAEDVSEGKPSPEGYLKGIQQLNSQPPLPERLVHPHEVLAIEDTPAGLQAAAGAGLVTLGVAQTYTRENLAMADMVADRISDLRVSQLQRDFAEASRR